MSCASDHCRLPGVLKIKVQSSQWPVKLCATSPALACLTSSPAVSRVQSHLRTCSSVYMPLPFKYCIIVSLTSYPDQSIESCHQPLLHSQSSSPPHSPHTHMNENFMRAGKAGALFHSLMHFTSPDWDLVQGRDSGMLIK